MTSRESDPPRADVQRAAELAEANRQLEREIAQRRAAEDSLRAAQEMLHLALRGANVVLWSWNPLTNDSWVSPRFWTQLGYEPGELPNSLEHWMDLIHPDDKARVLELARRAAENTDSNAPAEFRARRKDGAYAWILSVGGPIERDSEGHPLRWAGCHVDVTQRRELEERIRQRELELGHVARMHALGELASGLAHEVNQPLAAIVTDAGTCEAVLNSSRDEAAELVDEGLRRIGGSARRAKEIISRLRRTARKQPSAWAPVDLLEIARGAEAIVVYRLSTEAIHVAIELPEQALPKVQADPVQIEQVLVNLLQNAVDAVRGLPSAPRSVQVVFSQTPEEVAVEVRDSGPGVAAEARQQIFDAFFTTKHDGLGIGLSLCRTIIEAHGGRIECLESQGRGAVFRFTLPRQR